MTELRSEMAANVWKINIVAGATVKTGDELVILESMKMEIPVVAPHDAVVADVPVNEGDQVSTGDVLVVLSQP